MVVKHVGGTNHQHVGVASGVRLRQLRCSGAVAVSSSGIGKCSPKQPAATTTATHEGPLTAGKAQPKSSKSQLLISSRGTPVSLACLRVQLGTLHVEALVARRHYHQRPCILGACNCGQGRK